AVDVDAQGAAAVENCGGEKCLPASFDPLLQILLDAILIRAAQRTNRFRQISKTTDRCFNLPDALKIRQSIQARRQILRQFDVPVDRSRVSALAHEFETHPKLEGVEAPSSHLAIAKKVVFRVGKAAILA